METPMDDGHPGLCSRADAAVLVESTFTFGYVEVGHVGGGRGPVHGFSMQRSVAAQVCGHVAQLSGLGELWQRFGSGGI